MSPEQIHQGANSIGPATDVYGLGAILYELLTGRPPFVGASVAAIIHSVAKNDPVAPRRIRPNVARDLEAICLKCLEKDPRRRYESASALVEELERFIAGKPIQARQIRLWEQAIRWTRRHPAPTALIAMFFFGTMTVCWQWYRAETHRVDAERQTIAAVAAREAEREERNRVEHSLYARNITLAQHEYESNYTTRARQLLAETPEHLRNWEYDYLFQTVHSEMYDFAEFNLPVLAVAVSPNGKCAAASCALWGNNVDCETRVWDINTGMLRFVLTGHSSSVMDVDFSPDSRYIATAGNVWRASPRAFQLPISLRPAASPPAAVAWCLVSPLRDPLSCLCGRQLSSRPCARPPGDAATLTRWPRSLGCVHTWRMVRLPISLYLRILTVPCLATHYSWHLECIT